jgi:hypothetical protein
MIPRWVPYVLTFLQAIYLAGALPRPQAHGVYGPDTGSPCSDTGPELFAESPTIPANTLSARQTASAASSFPDSTSSTYTSAITIVQPGRPVTVVTSTDLSSTQVPTTTSASQTLPDTTGVRIYQAELGHLLTLGRVFRLRSRQQATLPLSPSQQVYPV